MYIALFFAVKYVGPGRESNVDKLLVLVWLICGTRLGQILRMHCETDPIDC